MNAGPFGLTFELEIAPDALGRPQQKWLGRAADGRTVRMTLANRGASQKYIVEDAGRTFWVFGEFWLAPGQAIHKVYAHFAFCKSTGQVIHDPKLVGPLAELAADAMQRWPSDDGSDGSPNPHRLVFLGRRNLPAPDRIP
jgi:hypothetical protein